MIELNNCRVCKSYNIKKKIFSKTFYLSNIDQKIPLSYGICLDCQYIFQDKYVGDDFLNSYYQNSPMYRNPSPTKYDIKSVRRQIKFLNRNIDLKNISSCLEIGAHTGHFLQELKKNYNLSIYYDELSEEAQLILRSFEGFKNYKNHNVKVEFIILRHVLEHINDLDSFMKFIENALISGGIIFIEIPDWTILDSKTDPFMFEHLSQFNDKCLIDFFAKKGYSLIALEKSIKKDDPSTPNRVMRLIFKNTKKPEFGNNLFLNYFKDYYDKKHKGGRTNLNKIFSRIERNKSVAFFPASNLSFSAVLETNLNQINFLGYFDSDPKKKHKKYLGFKVFSPNQLKEIAPDIILYSVKHLNPKLEN